ncbi:hypothetical protein Syun_022888 [Stephania yunnanensis]|uniref:Multiple inositol polyphosphate phosphatase 1 n=1 Tax=Stephania yunnanensis TaxID=152371 RepID=A0AAP0FFV7_9MAGN
MIIEIHKTAHLTGNKGVASESSCISDPRTFAFVRISEIVFPTTENSIEIHHVSANEDDSAASIAFFCKYGVVRDVANNSFVPSSIPDGCKPIHINLVARHGTRSPTKKRMKELDRLASHLDVLLTDAKRKVEEGHASLDKIPSWLWGWQSPWKGKKKGGELVSIGEDELYHLGVRIRERFPDLFDEEYHPDTYTIRATQVHRASASAVAFGMGLFSGKGLLDLGNIVHFLKSQEPAVEKLKEPVLDEVASALVRRYQLNFTRQEVASLWFLCKQEASLLDKTDQACGLFTPAEAFRFASYYRCHPKFFLAIEGIMEYVNVNVNVNGLVIAIGILQLEWTDDLEGFILKGYGESVNYRMGLPLLEDVVQSMENAIKAKEEYQTPGSYEKARLRFAHAETVVPFSCLLGLFIDGSGKLEHEQPLEIPPSPPLNRTWRGSMVAPFAGNNMLVLYSCPAESKSKYFLQVLHNEVPVPLPGCNYTDFCPFEVFKERVVNPHLKHDYNSVCRVKTEESVPGTTRARPSF